MARSFRKEPVVKDHSTGMKAIANRTLRRRLKEVSFDVANGNSYRKVVCSYDICDWWFRESYAEYAARAVRYNHEYISGVYRWGIRTSRDMSEDMNYWQWFKIYKRK